ncbi:MAG: hypothetical protein V1720_03750, partial [bacterium]
LACIEWEQTHPGFHFPLDPDGKMFIVNEYEKQGVITMYERMSIAKIVNRLKAEDEKTASK